MQSSKERLEENKRTKRLTKQNLLSTIGDEEVDYSKLLTHVPTRSQRDLCQTLKQYIGKIRKVVDEYSFESAASSSTSSDTLDEKCEVVHSLPKFRPSNQSNLTKVYANSEFQCPTKTDNELSRSKKIDRENLSDNSQQLKPNHTPYIFSVSSLLANSSLLQRKNEADFVEARIYLPKSCVLEMKINEEANRNERPYPVKESEFDLNNKQKNFSEKPFHEANRFLEFRNMNNKQKYSNKDKDCFNLSKVWHQNDKSDLSSENNPNSLLNIEQKSSLDRILRENRNRDFAPTSNYKELKTESTLSANQKEMYHFSKFTRCLEIVEDSVSVSEFKKEFDLPKIKFLGNNQSLNKTEFQLKTKSENESSDTPKINTEPAFQITQSNNKQDFSDHKRSFLNYKEKCNSINKQDKHFQVFSSLHPIEENEQRNPVSGDEKITKNKQPLDSLINLKDNSIKNSEKLSQNSKCTEIPISDQDSNQKKFQDQNVKHKSDIEYSSLNNYETTSAVKEDHRLSTTIKDHLELKQLDPDKPSSLQKKINSEVECANLNRSMDIFNSEFDQGEILQCSVDLDNYTNSSSIKNQTSVMNVSSQIENKNEKSLSDTAHFNVQKSKIPVKCRPSTKYNILERNTKYLESKLKLKDGRLSACNNQVKITPSNICTSSSSDSLKESVVISTCKKNLRDLVVDPLRKLSTVQVIKEIKIKSYSGDVKNSPKHQKISQSPVDPKNKISSSKLKSESSTYCSSSESSVPKSNSIGSDESEFAEFRDKKYKQHRSSAEEDKHYKKQHQNSNSSSREKGKSINNKNNSAGKSEKTSKNYRKIELENSCPSTYKRSVRKSTLTKNSYERPITKKIETSANRINQKLSNNVKENVAEITQSKKRPVSSGSTESNDSKHNKKQRTSKDNEKSQLTEAKIKSDRNSDCKYKTRRREFVNDNQEFGEKYFPEDCCKKHNNNCYKSKSKDESFYKENTNCVQNENNSYSKQEKAYQGFSVSFSKDCKTHETDKSNSIDKGTSCDIPSKCDIRQIPQIFFPRNIGVFRNSEKKSAGNFLQKDKERETESTGQSSLQNTSTYKQMNTECRECAFKNRYNNFDSAIPNIEKETESIRPPGLQTGSTNNQMNTEYKECGFRNCSNNLDSSVPKQNKKTSCSSIHFLEDSITFSQKSSHQILEKNKHNCKNIKNDFKEDKLNFSPPSDFLHLQNREKSVSPELNDKNLSEISPKCSCRQCMEASNSNNNERFSNEVSYKENEPCSSQKITESRNKGFMEDNASYYKSPENILEVIKNISLQKLKSGPKFKENESENLRKACKKTADKDEIVPKRKQFNDSYRFYDSKETEFKKNNSLTKEKNSFTPNEKKSSQSLCSQFLETEMVVKKTNRQKRPDSYNSQDLPKDKTVPVRITKSNSKHDDYKENMTCNFTNKNLTMNNNVSTERAINKTQIPKSRSGSFSSISENDSNLCYRISITASKRKTKQNDSNNSIIFDNKIKNYKIPKNQDERKGKLKKKSETKQLDYKNSSSESTQSFEMKKKKKTKANKSKKDKTTDQGCSCNLVNKNSVESKQSKSSSNSLRKIKPTKASVNSRKKNETTKKLNDIDRECSDYNVSTDEDENCAQPSSNQVYKTMKRRHSWRSELSMRRKKYRKPLIPRFPSPDALVKGKLRQKSGRPIKLICDQSQKITTPITMEKFIDRVKNSKSNCLNRNDCNVSSTSMLLNDVVYSALPEKRGKDGQITQNDFIIKSVEVQTCDGVFLESKYNHVGCMTINLSTIATQTYNQSQCCLNVANGTKTDESPVSENKLNDFITLGENLRFERSAAQKFNQKFIVFPVDCGKYSKMFESPENQNININFSEIDKLLKPYTNACSICDKYKESDNCTKKITSSRSFENICSNNVKIKSTETQCNICGRPESVCRNIPSATNICEPSFINQNESGEYVKNFESDNQNFCDTITITLKSRLAKCFEINGVESLNNYSLESQESPIDGDYSSDDRDSHQSSENNDCYDEDEYVECNSSIKCNEPFRECETTERDKFSCSIDQKDSHGDNYYGKITKIIDECSFQPQYDTQKEQIDERSSGQRRNSQVKDSFHPEIIQKHHNLDHEPFEDKMTHRESREIHREFYSKRPSNRRPSHAHYQPHQEFESEKIDNRHKVKDSDSQKRQEDFDTSSRHRRQSHVEDKIHHEMIHNRQHPDSDSFEDKISDHQDRERNSEFHTRRPSHRRQSHAHHQTNQESESGKTDHRHKLKYSDRQKQEEDLDSASRHRRQSQVKDKIHHEVIQKRQYSDSDSFEDDMSHHQARERNQEVYLKTPSHRRQSQAHPQPRKEHESENIDHRHRVKDSNHQICDAIKIMDHDYHCDFKNVCDKRDHQISDFDSASRRLSDQPKDDHHLRHETDDKNYHNIEEFDERVSRHLEVEAKHHPRAESQTKIRSRRHSISSNRNGESNVYDKKNSINIPENEYDDNFNEEIVEIEEQEVIYDGSGGSVSKKSKRSKKCGKGMKEISIQIKKCSSAESDDSHYKFVAHGLDTNSQDRCSSDEDQFCKQMSKIRAKRYQVYNQLLCQLSNLQSSPQKTKDACFCSGNCNGQNFLDQITTIIKFLSEFGNENSCNSKCNTLCSNNYTNSSVRCQIYTKLLGIVEKMCQLTPNPACCYKHNQNGCHFQCILQEMKRTLNELMSIETRENGCNHFCVDYNNFPCQKECCPPPCDAAIQQIYNTMAELDKLDRMEYSCCPCCCKKLKPTSFNVFIDSPYSTKSPEKISLNSELNARKNSTDDSNQSKALQEYLYTARPDFLISAEERRKYIQDLAKKRKENSFGIQRIINLMQETDFSQNINERDARIRSCLKQKNFDDFKKGNVKFLPKAKPNFTEDKNKCANRILLNLFNKMVKELTLKGKTNIPVEKSVLNYD